MLFVAKCLDSYLTDDGRLGFVITASVFQSELAGTRFQETVNWGRASLIGLPILTTCRR